MSTWFCDQISRGVFTKVLLTSVEVHPRSRQHLQRGHRLVDLYVPGHGPRALRVVLAAVGGEESEGAGFQQEIA